MGDFSKISSKKALSIPINPSYWPSILYFSKWQHQYFRIQKKIILTERTFEQRFLVEIGVTPKNLTRIIQFQRSNNQMSGPNTSNTMDIVFENGFTDQLPLYQNLQKIERSNYIYPIS